MSIDSDDNVYAVEDIVDMKKTKDGKELYLIKWLNYGVAHNSWEPAKNILDVCPGLLKEFHDKRNKKVTDAKGKIIDAERNKKKAQKRAVKIKGIEDNEGKDKMDFRFLILFDNESAQLIDRITANEKHTQLVIDFYEKNLKFKQLSDNNN